MNEYEFRKTDTLQISSKHAQTSKTATEPNQALRISKPPTIKILSLHLPILYMALPLALKCLELDDDSESLTDHTPWSL